MSEKATDKPKGQSQLPDLIIRDENLPAAAKELAKRFAASGSFFQRGEHIIKAATSSDGVKLIPLGVHGVVNAAHEICRPVVEYSGKGKVILCPKTLPDRVARLLLSSLNDSGLLPLDGLCSAPILNDDGSIRTACGYDPATRYWCTGTEIPALPDRPSREESEHALRLLRCAFATFPFADGAANSGAGLANSVDLDKSPQMSESTFLAALLTAVCRPSLPLAPAVLIRAPLLSGAGTGKGILARAAARIAYDFSPSAFASGGDRVELDKRVAAAMMKAAPIVFLDNVNATTIRSELIAQIVTESECETRPLGVSRMVRLTANVFVAVTGNGVRLAEDLARRFLVVNLDAGCENPEQRRFDDERFLDTIKVRRLELLAAAVTIWRWGRQNDLPRGRPLGSFEQWTEWVRDPLLALGCLDPIDQINEIKEDDPQQRQLAEFLDAWYRKHGDKSIAIQDLDISVRAIAGLQGSNRQQVATFVASMENTQVGGFRVTRRRHGKWSASTYAVTKIVTSPD